MEAFPALDNTREERMSAPSADTIWGRLLTYLLKYWL